MDIGRRNNISPIGTQALATGEDQIVKTSDAVSNKCSTGGEMITLVIAADGTASI